MKLLVIIRAIEQLRGRPQLAYTSWAIGTTSDSDTAKKTLQNLWSYPDQEFLCLPAETQADADDIVEHFRMLGMKNGQEVKIPPGRHVFVYYNRW